MIQLHEGLPDDTVIEQIVTKLNLNGYQNLSVETGGNRQAVIQLEDINLRICLDFHARKCSVEAKQTMGQLKTVSELVSQCLLFLLK
jgi:hypothetical protein